MRKIEISLNEKNEILNSAKSFLNSNKKEINYDKPESPYLKVKDIVDDDYYWAYDAKRYTTFPCPKGFLKDKNRVSIELAEAITVLFKMNEIETLKKIANLLKNARADMKYTSWLKECRIKLPEAVYSAIEVG